MLTTVAQWAGFSVGLVLVCVGLFVYEDEHQRIRSVLEDWWRGIRDAGQAWDSRVAQFCRRVAFGVGSRLDWLFGREVISLRFAAVSFLISYLSYKFYVLIYYLVGVRTPRADGNHDYCIEIPILQKRSCVLENTLAQTLGSVAVPISYLVVIVLLAAALRWLPKARVSLRVYFIAALLLSVIPAAYTSVLAVIYDIPRNHWRLISGPLLNLIAIGSDAVSIIVTRRVLRKIASERIPLRIAGLVLLDLVVMVALVAVPLLVSGNNPQGDWFRGCFAIAGSNVSVALATLAWVSFGVLLLLHAVFWPLASRVVWMVRFRLLLSSKHALLLGVFLTALCFPWGGSYSLATRLAAAAALGGFGAAFWFAKGAPVLRSGGRKTVSGEPGEHFDVFISHASEDKESLAQPLADALGERGIKVWIDAASIAPGDGIAASIDRGLAASRVGVVVLSQSFFKRKWTENELNALAVLEALERVALVPIWHGIDEHEVAFHSPMLAGRLGLDSQIGVEALADEIAAVAAEAYRLVEAQLV